MASPVPGVLNGAPQEMTTIPTKGSKVNSEHTLAEKPVAVEQHESTNGVVNIPISSQPVSFADGVKASKAAKPSMKHPKTLPIKTQKQSRPDPKKRSSTATPVKAPVKQQADKNTSTPPGKDEKRSLRSQDRDASSVTRSKLIFDFDYSSMYF